MARAFSTKTKLGQMLKASGLKKWELGYAAGINERVLTELLAGRRGLSNRELTALCAVFGCKPRDLDDGMV